MTFTLYGQLPGGKDNIKITRTGKRYPNARFKAWRERMARNLIKNRGQGQLSTARPLWLYVDYYKGDLRRRDVDSMTGAIFHLLQYLGVIQDDSQIEGVIWNPCGLDRQHPRAICELRTTKREDGVPSESRTVIRPHERPPSH